MMLEWLGRGLRLVRTLKALMGLLAILSQSAAAQATHTTGDASTFDFLLGTWETTGQLTSADDAPPDVGLMTVTPLFHEAGAVGVRITTRQFPLDDAAQSAFGLTTFESESLFVFQSDAGRWRGMGHNSLGNRKWIEVEVSDGQVRLLHTGELFGGVPGVTRCTYLDIRPDSWSMRVDYSEDGTHWTQGTYLMEGRRVREGGGG